MELRVLHYFLTVAREQSITRAAQSLHLSQPTLSRQLSSLEKEFGRGSGSGNRQAAADPGQPANCPDGGRDAAAQTGPGNPGPGDEN